MKKVSGKIVYVDISGGFWGIEGKGGAKLNPGDSLPGAFRKEGLKIECSYVPTMAFGISMWGQEVKILDIHKST